MMPSHKIHVAIAQEINKELGLNSDEISLGSVLPDLVNTHSHSAPHFQTRMVYPDNLANPDQFVKEYGVKDAISMGYLLHLITDKFYNQKYLEKFFVFEDGKPSKPLIDIDPQERHYVKKHDFNEYDRYLTDEGHHINHLSKEAFEYYYNVYEPNQRAFEKSLKEIMTSSGNLDIDTPFGGGADKKGI